MFRRNFFPLIIVALLCPLLSDLNAQVFLQADHLEFYVSDRGTMIPLFPPPIPAGFHPTEPTTFGVVSDVRRADWASATSPAYCGDYLAPGSPVDGFSVNVGGAVGTNYRNDAALSLTDLPGSVTEVENGPGRYRYAVWETNGTTPIGLRITRVAFEDRQYIYTVVDFCNNTGSDQTELYYGANWDPDNEQPWTGDYTTSHTVLSQTSTGDPLSSISSNGLIYGCSMLTSSADPRSKTSYGSFYTGDAYDMWNGILPYTTAISSNTTDEANQISFNLGPMLDGECTCFSYVTVFLSGEENDATARLPVACSEVAALLADPTAKSQLDLLAPDASAQQSGLTASPIVYPNPASQFATIDLSAFDGEITIQLLNLAGQVVLERTAVRGGTQMYLPVEGLPAGIYTVSLSGQNFNHRTSMVIR